MGMGVGEGKEGGGGGGGRGETMIMNVSVHKKEKKKLREGKRKNDVQSFGDSASQERLCWLLSAMPTPKKKRKKHKSKTKNMKNELFFTHQWPRRFRHSTRMDSNQNVE